jgi:adenosine deaminase CECR1
VGEEDIGHSLLFHSDALIQGLNYSLNSNESFKYYFHTGETNWPTDIYTSEYSEDSSTDDNVFDAILFKTKRIGHGLAYFKHPNLYPYLKNNKIAIETCPASNQILG